MIVDKIQWSIMGDGQVLGLIFTFLTHVEDRGLFFIQFLDQIGDFFRSYLIYFLSGFFPGARKAPAGEASIAGPLQIILRHK